MYRFPSSFLFKRLLCAASVFGLLAPVAWSQARVQPERFVDSGDFRLGNMTFGPEGDLYVALPFLDAIGRYDGASGAFIDVFVAEGSGGLDFPANPVFGPDGHLYVVSRFTGEVLRFDGLTGAFLDVVAPDRAGYAPDAITFGPDGYLYVAEQAVGGGVVSQYDVATGTFLGEFVATGSGGLDCPDALTFGPDGQLYVLTGKDACPRSVLRYDGATGAFIDAFVPAAGASDFSASDGFQFGPDGHLYVTSREGAFTAWPAVRRYDGETGALIDIYTGLPAMSLENNIDMAFEDVAFGPDGRLYLPFQSDVVFLSEHGGSRRSYPQGVAVAPRPFVEAGDLTLILTPHASTVPPEGGTIPFDLAITNAAVSSAFHVWSVLRLPDGSERVSSPAFHALGTGETFERPAQKQVPGEAPPGTYTLTVVAGAFPDGAVASAGFTFEKLASGLVATPLGRAGAASLAESPVGAYPNPFTDGTEIRFALTRPGSVQLTVYNVLGQEVTRLADGYAEAGPQRVRFDGSGLPSGVYFYRLSVGAEVVTGQLRLLR